MSDSMVLMYISIYTLMYIVNVVYISIYTLKQSRTHNCFWEIWSL